jgi:choline-sulfatase
VGSAALTASCMSCRRHGVEGTNVLVLCADQHHAGFMGSAGHPDAVTPNLDRLALEGVSAARCMVTAPTCAPTRQSWLTGRYVPEHGQLSNQFVLNRESPSLIRGFADAGYDTACFGKLHTWTDEDDGAFGFNRILNTHSAGWQDVRQAYRTPPLGAWETSPVSEQALWDGMPFDGFNGRQALDPAVVPDWVLAQETVRFLGERRRTPFFCMLSLQSPHFPFWLPKDVYGTFDPDALSLPDMTPSASLAAMKQMALHGFDSMTEAHHRLVLARYLDATQFMDALVGEVLDALDALGLAENTLVVYQADHGDQCGEKGLWLKSVCFDAAARKPLILRMPGVLDAGRVYEGVVSEVDLLPTALGLCGLEVPSSSSGLDLSSALVEDEAGRTHAFAGLHWPIEGGRPWMEMVTDGRHKLIRYAEEPPVFELYDLEDDPDESRDVAGVRVFSDVVQALDAELAAHAEGLDACPFPIVPV